MDKVREEFEKWISSYIGESWLGKSQDDFDDYKDDNTQFMWEAWQASRAKLCIELPRTPSFSASDEPDLAFEEGVDVMKEIIEAVGVTCK